MTDYLVIFAAGKSSRFDGFPKAFCDVGQRKNVENTILLAQPYFREIFLVINEETHASGVAEGLPANVVSIVTGQGDADSILKSIKQLEAKLRSDTITACWGDAVFLSSEPFRDMEKGVSVWTPDSPALVGCSVDPDPYAWFDVEESKIALSHFKKREPTVCKQGLHDQSIFTFRIKLLLEYLERYKRHLGLDVYGEDSYDAARGEMSLLDAFTWFYTQPDMNAAEYCEVTANQVMGFNTPEELDVVVNMLREIKNQGDIKC